MDRDVGDSAEWLLFSADEQNNSKFGLKKWLKEHDNMKICEKSKSIKVFEKPVKAVPDSEPKEKKKMRKQMIVKIPR